MHLVRIQNLHPSGAKDCFVTDSHLINLQRLAEFAEYLGEHLDGGEKREYGRGIQRMCMNHFV